MIFRTLEIVTTNDQNTMKRLHVFTCTVRTNTKDGITVGIVHNGHLVLRTASSLILLETGSETLLLALKRKNNVSGRHLESLSSYKMYTQIS